MLNLSLAHPDLELDDADCVAVHFPGLDRPGLLHVPTMRVVPPLSGADGSTDDDDADDDKDDDDDKKKGKPKPKGKGKDDDADDDKDDDDEEDEDDADDDDPLVRARAALAATNKENKRLKREQADAATAAKKEAGKWQELYKDEKARADKLEADKEETDRKTLAVAALDRLKCKNSARYVKLLDLDDVEDDAGAERAAKKLLKSDPDLFGKATTRQKRGAGAKNDDDDDETTDDKKTPKKPVNRLRAGLAKTGK